ncbi:MAG: TlpA family protein disulfide reductase [Gemmatimonadaceae bacterium]
MSQTKQLSMVSVLAKLARSLAWCCAPLILAGCDRATPRPGVPAATERTAPAAEVAVDADSTTEPDSLPHLSLPDLTGRRTPLRARADEVTVINFWATWCVPCLREIPELVALSEQWKSQNVHVVGVAIESGDPADVATFASAHGMRYTLLAAQQRWARRHFAVIGLPVTIVADRSGVIRRRLIGPQTRAQFEAAVRDALVHRGTTATP